jgi:hypothetical protein
MGIKDDYQPVEGPPPARLVKGQEVSLGCGTLILIALIVMFFGGRGVGDLQREMRRLQDEVRQLRTTIELQTGQIQALEKQLDQRLSPAAAAEATAPQ